MTITTTQVTAADALRAVADGKSVQMIWMDDGKPFFSNFTEKIESAMEIGDAFLIVEVEDDKPEPIPEAVKAEWAKAEYPTDENAEKVASSQQNIAESCENAAEEIPPEPKAPKKKLDDGKIMALYHAGWSAAKIADEMSASQQAIHAHLKKLREEGRL